MFSHITNVLKTKYISQEKRKRSNSTVYLLQNQEIHEKVVQQNCNQQEHYKEEESQKQQQRFLGPDIDVNISSPILRNRRNGLCEIEMQKDITEVRLKVLLKSMEGCVW